MDGEPVLTATVLGLPLWALLLLLLTVALGAVVQGTVGLGLSLLTAPVLGLLAPELLPGSLLFLAALLPLGTLLEGRDQVDGRALVWAVPPRLPATALGAWLVLHLDTTALALAIGLSVLAMTGLSASRLRMPVGPVTLVGAGTVSGVIGTISGIGGPPMALLLQHRPPEQLRQTLAVYFTLGATLSLIAVGLTGSLTWEQAGIAGLLLPAVVVGLLLAPLVRRRLPKEQVRVGVLLLCGVSALALVGRSLVTLLG